VVLGESPPRPQLPQARRQMIGQRPISSLFFFW